MAIKQFGPRVSAVSSRVHVVNVPNIQWGCTVDSNGAKKNYEAVWNNNQGGDENSKMNTRVEKSAKKWKYAANGLNMDEDDEDLVDPEQSECLAAAVAQYGDKVTAKHPTLRVQEGGFTFRSRDSIPGYGSGSDGVIPPPGCSVQGPMGDYSAFYNSNTHAPKGVFGYYVVKTKRKPEPPTPDLPDTDEARQECLDDAKRQFGAKVTARRYIQVGRWAHVPSGCSVELPPGDWAAHYNLTPKIVGDLKKYKTVLDEMPTTTTTLKPRAGDGFRGEHKEEYEASAKREEHLDETQGALNGKMPSGGEDISEQEFGEDETSYDPAGRLWCSLCPSHGSTIVAAAAAEAKGSGSGAGSATPPLLFVEVSGTGKGSGESGSGSGSTEGDPGGGKAELKAAAAELNDKLKTDEGGGGSGGGGGMAKVECKGVDGYCEGNGNKGKGRSWCKYSGAVDGMSVLGASTEGTAKATACYYCEEAGEGQPAGTKGCKKCQSKLTAPHTCESCPDDGCLTKKRRCRAKSSDEGDKCEAIAGEEGPAGGEAEAKSGAGGGGTEDDGDDEDADLAAGKQMNCQHCPADGAAKCKGSPEYCNSSGKRGGTKGGKTWCQTSGKAGGPFTTREVRGLTDQTEEGATRCFYCQEGSGATDCQKCKDEMVQANQCEVCNKPSKLDPKTSKCRLPKNAGR
jgi:hypothetical protein